MLKPNLPSLKPGDLVAGRFRVVEMVGSGGFSVVYRARQEEMNRFVALKVLKPRAATDARVVERFRREALYASHLSHPNTITLFDYGHTDEGLFYIAMEFLVGMDLSVVVQRGEPMNLGRVWKILVQCCRSLAEAHRLGLVHRDLKPENIFLVQREEGGESVKVLDFGVSKAISTFGNAGPATMAPLTQEGTVFGTPLYMAPEQAMAEQISPAVDVYALGHIAFEMATGRAAYWDCNNPMDVMLRQVNDPPLALPAPWNKTPFSKLITRCTQKNPKKRIADASKLLEYLMDDRFLEYMDPGERPVSTRSMPAIPTSIAGQFAQPVARAEDVKVEEMYRWELKVLEDAFEQVRHAREPRMVVLRGRPGTGRSNLLRAFLRKAKSQHNVSVIHRQTAGGHIPADAGLEADIAIAAGLDLKSRGFDEVKRLMKDMYGSQLPEDMNAERELTSGPLNTLVSMRDAFLSRIAVPFREKAVRGTVVWGVENLERADTLTVSFLDRFYKDLQVRHVPILIVVTVSPDDLIRRPGMSRYGERLLAATRPYGRQLSILPPGERKNAGQGDVEYPGQNTVEELAVSGSYLGEMPSNNETFLDEVAQHERASIEVGAKTQPFRVEDVFASALEQEESSVAQVTTSANPSEDDTFDRVLGYLAQCGNEIPYGLWRSVNEQVLGERLGKVSPLIMDQAERFGIIHQTSDRVLFTKHSYAHSLRENFVKLDGAREIQSKFANILMDFYPSPNREQLKLIVEHLIGSGRHSEAIQMLRDEGQRAFRTLDFDAAREYFLKIQQLIDGLEISSPIDLDGDGVVESIDIERPRLWIRLAEIHGALHEYGAAEDAINRALKELPERDDALEGRGYKLLGDLNSNQNRYDEALRHYERAQQSLLRSGAANAYVAVTGEMGHCALMQGRPSLARDLLKQALDNAIKLKDAMLLARLEKYLGQALTTLGQFAEASNRLESSMERFEAMHRDVDVVECLEELGRAAYASTQFDRSRDYYTQAIVLSASAHVKSGRSPHLGLARALAALGNLDQAQVHLVEALNTSMAVSDPFRAAEVNLYMGDLYLAMEQAEPANAHFNEVIKISKEIGHTRLWLDALIRLAYVSFELDQANQTYELLTKAGEMAQAIGDRDAEFQIRTHIIFFQLMEHNFDVRGDTFSSLLDVSKKLKLSRTPVLCWLFRADVSAARKQWAVARDELRQAYMHAGQLGDYSLFILIARRDYLLQQRLGNLGDPHVGSGWAIGALIPPEIGARRGALAGEYTLRRM